MKLNNQIDEIITPEWKRNEFNILEYICHLRPFPSNINIEIKTENEIQQVESERKEKKKEK